MSEITRKKLNRILIIFELDDNIDVIERKKASVRESKEVIQMERKNK